MNWSEVEVFRHRHVHPNANPNNKVAHGNLDKLYTQFNSPYKNNDYSSKYVGYF